jgi:hypothetical protein
MLNYLQPGLSGNPFFAKAKKDWERKTEKLP